MNRIYITTLKLFWDNLVREELKKLIDNPDSKIDDVTMKCLDDLLNVIFEEFG